MFLQLVNFTDIRKLTYISLNGGADAIKQPIDGFTQAMTGDMSMVHGGVVR
jgi:putative tricarboxylic transport membrane protein